MADIDGEAIQQVMLGGIAISGAAWAVWERWLKGRVDNANTSVAVTVAEGAQTVYKMMEERLTTLEKDVQGVRVELSQERTRSRKLELHIFKLEALMRVAGIDPPAYEG